MHLTLFGRLEVIYLGGTQIMPLPSVSVIVPALNEARNIRTFSNGYLTICTR